MILLFFGTKYLSKKIKKKQENLQEEIEKEFKEGKIVLPIDKRDFENFKEFEDKTKNIKKVNDNLKNMEKDFDKFEMIKEEPREEDITEIKEENGKGE